MNEHQKTVTGAHGRVKLSGVGPFTPPAGVPYFMAIEAVQGSAVTYNAAGCIAKEADTPFDGSTVPTRLDFWPAAQVQFNEAGATCYGYLSI